MFFALAAFRAATTLRRAKGLMSAPILPGRIEEDVEC
jgi:hypothetical protein